VKRAATTCCNHSAARQILQKKEGVITGGISADGRYWLKLPPYAAKGVSRRYLDIPASLGDIYQATSTEGDTAAFAVRLCRGAGRRQSARLWRRRKCKSGGICSISPGRLANRLLKYR